MEIKKEISHSYFFFQSSKVCQNVNHTLIVSMFCELINSNRKFVF
jgi:hypothetical protein